MSAENPKPELKKEEKIKKEIGRLNRQLSDVDPKKKKIVENLVKKAAFMSVTLEDLESAMNENGVVSEYQNGENQWGTKKSPEVEIYNTMVKNYASIIKQLTDLKPKDVPKHEDDGFDEFVSNK